MRKNKLLYHTVYNKGSEDLIKKTLEICEKGLTGIVSEKNLRTRFAFFNSNPQDAKNPIVTAKFPKKIIWVADRTNKTETWVSSIIHFETWKKTFSKFLTQNF